MYGDGHTVGQEILIWRATESVRRRSSSPAASARALSHPAVKEIVYDPWQFIESAEILAERGLPMVEFPQNASRMAPASETLYELIVEGRVVHDGNATMKEQVLCAVIAPTERGGWRISKRRSLEKIDGAVSLAIVARCRAVLMRSKTASRVVHVTRSCPYSSRGQLATLLEP